MMIYNLFNFVFKSFVSQYNIAVGASLTLYYFLRNVILSFIHNGGY